MADYNERSAIARARMADIRDKLSQAQKTGGLLQVIGEAGEGAYELGRGLLAEGKNILGNVLFGEKYTPVPPPTAENSEIARRIMSDWGIESFPTRFVKGNRVGASSVSIPLDRPYSPPPPFDPRSVKQRVADADRARRDLTTDYANPMSPIPVSRNTLGETGAQEYMREARKAVEVEQARQNSRSRDPSIVTNQALKTGAEQSEYTSERSMLDRMYQSGLLDTLIGMSRAERKYGVGPVAAFSEAFQDVQTTRAATEAAQAKAKLELQKEQIKKSGPQEFKAPLIKSINTASSLKSSLDSINEYMQVLSNARIGGLAGKTEEAYKAIGALFGYGGESAAGKARSLRASIMNTFESAYTKGQITKQNYENLSKILQEGGWFVSNPEVMGQLERLKSKLSEQLIVNSKILRAQGVDPGQFSPYNSGLVSARRPAQ
jgi:hypothetical protein